MIYHYQFTGDNTLQYYVHFINKDETYTSIPIKTGDKIVIVGSGQIIINK